VIQLGKLFLVGAWSDSAWLSLSTSFGHSQIPRPIEESSKLIAVILVMYGARGAGYKYELNGILFGCAAERVLRASRHPAMRC